MPRLFLSLLVVLLAGPSARALEAGFAETDITPKVDPKGKAVYLAGFGHNRKATRVHDPLKARCIVLRDGKQKIALVSVDLVGLFLEVVERVRKQCPGYAYLTVSSTHNHEGPDTMGLWGPAMWSSGIDPEYMKTLEKQIVAAVKNAEKDLKKVRAKIGSVKAPELLHDGRLPIVKHDDLVVLHFHDAKTKKPAGLVVQWNVHPELLGGKNTELSADHVGYTVAALKKTHKCPVVYITGTVGGLMTSLHLPLKNAKGEALKDGTFEKTERYGVLLAEAATKAVKAAKDVKLTPFAVKTKPVYLPLENKLYVLGAQLGVLKRQAYLWKNDPTKGEPVDKIEKNKKYSIRTEVAYLRLGDLDVACIPGEIYPELVLDKVQDPPDPGADFPKAPIEPAIYKQLKGPHRMMIGLASDEIGYIIPKRQWDRKPPFCYGLKKAQYGEVNSLGPDTAPLLCKAFKDLVAGK